MEKLKVTQILEQIMDLSKEETLEESVNRIFESTTEVYETPIIESFENVEVEMTEEEINDMFISEETLEMIKDLKEEALELISQLGD